VHAGFDSKVRVVRRRLTRPSARRCKQQRENQQGLENEAHECRPEEVG
jgi:hypothetical protein